MMGQKKKRYMHRCYTVYWLDYDDENREKEQSKHFEIKKSAIDFAKKLEKTGADASVVQERYLIDWRDAQRIKHSDLEVYENSEKCTAAIFAQNDGTFRITIRDKNGNKLFDREYAEYRGAKRIMKSLDYINNNWIRKEI